MAFKVANIIETFNSKSGGPPRTVSMIAAAGKDHWRADLFTTDYRHSVEDKLLVSEFPGHVNVMPSRAHTALGGLAMMAGINRHYRAQLLCGVAPDVIHIHGIWSLYLAAFACTAIRHGIPYVIAPHGMLEPWSLAVRRSRKALALSLYQRDILVRAAAIHATSRMEADNLKRLNIGHAPIFVIPNAVEEPLPMTPVPASNNEKRTLLFLSRLHEKKGLDLLLKAWNEVRPADWRLLIVGSGDAAYVHRLKQFCTVHRVPDVTFMPHVEGREREEVFSNAALFVLPTYSENFGNVIAEALIRGLPVITTTGTPWADIVEEGCGWYVVPAVGELQQAIRAATSSDSRTLTLMGKRGRAYATANFTMPAVRDSLLTMYRATIDRRTVADSVLGPPGWRRLP